MDRLGLALRIQQFGAAGMTPVDVVNAHNEIITKKGKVAFAKIGGSIDSHKIELLKKQIQTGLATFLYLIYKSKTGLLCFSGEINAIINGDLPKHYPYPGYYNALGISTNLWLVISSPLVATRFSGLILASNNKSLERVIKCCRTPSMLVKVVK